MRFVRASSTTPLHALTRPSGTASVLKGNKNASAIETAYNGMGHFKPLVTFEAATVAACMGGPSSAWPYEASLPGVQPCDSHL